MKKILIINICILISLVISLLSGCSDGGGGSSSTTSKTVEGGDSSTGTTLSGIVADGYLREAKVFLDRNGNRIYDNGEPLTQSTAGGEYSLAVNPNEGALYSVVVQVIAGQTVDEDSGAVVANDYFLESLPGHWEFISPLTTLVKLECDKNPSLSPQQAEIAIRTQFGLEDSISLFTDYLNPAGEDAAMIAEYDRLHRVAQVVAQVMGSLRASLTQNLSGEIADTEQRLAALVVSDQILWQAPQIKTALDNERNQVAVMDVSALAGVILDASDIENLNGDLLARYQQRLEQNFATWDMQPPQLQNQSPPAEGTAPVDTVVSVTFDEALDETLLTDGMIELTGPNGVVSGRLDYDAEQLRLSFTPNQALLPFSSYQVTVNRNLADALGNPLGEDLSWDFTTIFAQTPPPLPDF